MQRTEQPLRFLGEVARAATEHTAEMVTDGIEDHVETMHIPPKRTDPIQAVPFPDERIPDVELSKMIERMEQENLSLEQVARDAGRPLHLVLRCMADYDPQFRKFLQRRRTE